MDTSKVASYVGEILRGHQRALHDIAVHQTAFLELAAFIAVQEHYRIKGAAVRVVHPVGNVLAVKTSTRGHPSRFSRIEIEIDGGRFEAHMNLPVRGAYGNGVFCVDVGVVVAGTVPTKPNRKRGRETWRACDNLSLVSFAEVKKLVVYPMLLAHFIGIVHELLPSFLKGARPRGFKRRAHFDPLLLTLGSFSGTSSEVMKSFKKRKFKVLVIPAFDVRLGRLRGGARTSPFDLGSELGA